MEEKEIAVLVLIGFAFVGFLSLLSMAIDAFYATPTHTMNKCLDAGNEWSSFNYEGDLFYTCNPIDKDKINPCDYLRCEDTNNK